METFTIFCLLNWKIRQLLYQKSFHIKTVLKSTLIFLPSFSIDDDEKINLYANKNSKYLFDRFNDYAKAYSDKRQKTKNTQKIKDSIGLQKIEKNDRQFLVEKIIHSVEFKNAYENSIEKNPEIIDIVESNYRVIRRVNQHLYSDIADIFFEYIHSLDPNEIQKLDDDIKTNGWGVKNIHDIENPLEL